MILSEKKDCTSNYVQSVLEKTYEGCFQMKAYEFQNSFAGREIDDKKKFFSITKVSRLLIDHEAHRISSVE